MRKLICGLALALSTAVAFAQDKKPDPPAPTTPQPPATTPPATTPPAPAATTDYYPLKKNTKWTYKVGDATVEVKAGDAANGEVKLETFSNGKSVASETIKVAADGIYRTKINNTDVKPAVKILNLKDGKPTKGDKWTVESKIAAADVKGEFTTAATDASVKVGAGEFTNVVMVDGPKFNIANTETKVSYWFAAGKGIVKLSYSIAGVDSTLELSAFEEGK